MPATNVEKLLKALYDQEVEFIIIGGAAAVLHGSAYVTGDLDICYSREKENLKKLATALAPFSPSLRGAPIDLPFRLDADSLNSGLNFTLTTDLGDLDILGEVTGLGLYPAVLTFSEELEIFGIRCKVLTLEGLITSKRAVSRAKDLLLLPELEALLEIRKSLKKN
ncbi:MAG TPA: nucleotidyltransferase [Candidatus Binatia bacterium]